MNIDNIKELFKDKKFQEIKEQMSKWKPFDVGFNVFNLMSDIYYRENFHSDVLAEILNPNGKHEEGNKFLKLFFKFIDINIDKLKINDTYNTKLSDLIIFDDIKIFREKGRIDILIFSRKGKWAIIVENKIYDAQDRKKQIQKYMEYCENENKNFANIKFEVKAIIYISRKEHNKRPDWKTLEYDEEKVSQIEERFLCIPGYNESGKDIFSWLEQCELHSKTVNSQNVFQQYKNIVKKQGVNAMSNENTEKFFDLCKEKGIPINMLYTLVNGIPDCVRNYIKKEISNLNFDLEKVDIWREIVYMDYKYPGQEHRVAIDIFLSSGDKNSIEYKKFSLGIFSRGNEKKDIVSMLKSQKLKNIRIEDEEKIYLKISDEEEMPFIFEEKSNKYISKEFDLNIYKMESFFEKIKQILTALEVHKKNKN